jgi:hypothetical protein
MRLRKTTSVEEVQLVSRFEGLRRILLAEKYADHLDKPLAYWALPTDRRLPLALLGRTLRDLLDTSFPDLAATPGIGQKKINSFVRLLARAADTDPADLPSGMLPLDDGAPDAAADGNGAATDGFDPSNISEIVWSQWRASVTRHGLECEKLGRFAPSLRNMTRVIWNMPLGAYTGLGLAEIRAMKTHGEKRVRAILEVFHAVHALVAQMGSQPHLVVRIVPRLIDQVDCWSGTTLQTAGIPAPQQIAENFTLPLLGQVRIDASEQIGRLAENRLGVSGSITSVRQVARSMGLTRARVYQLLNEINDIMAVRWPNGRHQVYELREKFLSEAAHMTEPPDLSQFLAAVELFYPGARRGAAGPVELASDLSKRAEPAERGELVGVE